jgi:hypothetical protein
METAVDTSVLLDVLLADPQHAANSEAALRKAASEGGRCCRCCRRLEFKQLDSMRDSPK